MLTHYQNRNYNKAKVHFLVNQRFSWLQKGKGSGMSRQVYLHACHAPGQLSVTGGAAGWAAVLLFLNYHFSNLEGEQLEWMNEDMEQMKRRGEWKCKWRGKGVRKGERALRILDISKIQRERDLPPETEQLIQTVTLKRGMCGQSNTREKLVNEAQSGLCKARDKVRYNSQFLDIHGLRSRQLLSQQSMQCPAHGLYQG